MLISFLNSGIMGLDIGSSCIKLATLVKKNNTYRLENCDMTFLEKECFNEAGEILDFNYVQGIVIDLINRQKYKSNKIALSIPQRLVIEDVVNLSKDIPLEEQAYQMEVEANRMLPPGVSPSFDYYALPNNINNSITNINTQSFNILAASKDLVDSRLDLLQSLKSIKPIVMDSDALSALRNTYYVWQSEGVTDQVRVLLNLGHMSSYMFVIYNQDIVYKQNLATNGMQLTQSIMRYYDMSYQDAERKKCNQGLPVGYNEDVLIPYIENSVIDVIQGIQNFFSTSSLSRVDNMFISGGHGLVDGLATQIAKKTHISTQIFNPFLGLLRSPGIDEALLRKNMPMYTTAIGLALRGLSN